MILCDEILLEPVLPLGIYMSLQPKENNVPQNGHQ